MASPKDPPREPGFHVGPEGYGPDEIPPMYADDDFQPSRPARRPEPPAATRPAPSAGSPRPEVRQAAGPAPAPGPRGPDQPAAAPGPAGGASAGQAGGSDGSAEGGFAGAGQAGHAGPGPGGAPVAAVSAAAVSAAVESATADLTARLASLERELAEARAKATESQDNFLRASAEVENVRRRGREDVAKAQKFAIERFAEDLVPVKDSLDLALKVDNPTVESYREGVEMTQRQLTQAFQRNQLIEVDPQGEKFDPNQHQAISMVPSKEVPANHVVSVLQKGYLINDRVLRPALVAVSQGG